MALVQIPDGGPLISRLEAWGYREKSEAALPSIIGNLDPPSLTLLERLTDDLMHMNETAHNSKAEVAAIQGNMKLQQVKLEQALTENQRLTKTIGQITKELNGSKRLSMGVKSKECNIEEQVKQWRAQSMHQLQELERVNQALRSTLKIHCDDRPILHDHEAADEPQVLKKRQTSSESKAEHPQENIPQFSPTEQNEKLSGDSKQPLDTDVQICLKDSEQKVAHVGVCTRKKKLVMTPKLLRKAAELPALREVQGFKKKMDELQATLNSYETTISALRSEVSNKSDQLSFIMDEKAVGEEALKDSQLACSKMAALMTEAGIRKSSEDEIQTRCTNLRSELDRAQAQVSNLWLELDQTKRAQGSDQSKAVELKSELNKCMYCDALPSSLALGYNHSKNRMENAEQDVDQLKTLISQLCGTREDLVSRLQVDMLNEKKAEKRLFALDIEVQQKTKEAETHLAEVSHLRGLLQDLGQESAHLQSEINMQTGRISILTENNVRLEAEVRLLRTDLQATLQRLQDVNSLLSQAETECTALKEKLSFTETTNIQLEELWTGKCLEHSLTTKELESITCEHQMLKQDHSQLTNNHQELVDKHKSITTTLKQTEEALCAKGIIQEKILATNQEVLRENQQLKRSTIELENQVRYLQYNLQGMEDMFNMAMEQAKSLGEEIQNRASELKDMERQQYGLLNDCQNEKAALTSQLCLSKLEVETLTSSWRAEQQRVRELDHLLACLRVHQQQLEMAGMRSEYCPIGSVI